VGPDLISHASACNETSRTAEFDSHVYVTELRLLEMSVVE